MSLSIQKRLEAALATNDFKLLQSYTDPTSWSTMTLDQRELLALLLVKQGEQQLRNGDSKVLESFELASKAAPESSVIFFQQALAFSTQNKNIRCLMAASTALNKAIEIDPKFTNAWYGLGCVLIDIGTFNNDVSYYYQADSKFTEALRLASESQTSLHDEFYWQWGLCWYKLGKISGEATDFFKSLEKFQTSVENGFESTLFCSDYGNLLVDIAFLLGRGELLLQAVTQYKKVVAHFSDQPEAWMNLACTYQSLYEFFDNEEYFFEANQFFEQAVELNSEQFNTWFKWGDLYAYEGKKLKSVDHLKLSLLKFEKAHLCEPENSLILARWGEVQLLAASFMDDLEQLRESESKILKAIELEPEIPVYWYIAGACCNELGRYFNDVHYYEQAIAKFQRSLALESNHSVVYHGIAHAYYTIGEMTDNTKCIEESLQYYHRAVEAGHISSQPSSYNDWGVALLKLGELTCERKHVELAVEKFEKAIGQVFNEVTENEVDLEWLYNYGCAMDFLGDFHDESMYYERAIQVLSHVIQLDPSYTFARYNLALSLSHLGELNSDVDCFRSAIIHFELLLSQDNEDEYAWNDWGLSLTHLAVLTYDATHPDFSKDYYEQAEKKFLHAIALGNMHAFYNIACLYALTHNMPAAMHYLERADFCNALPSTEDVMHDEWLDNMRHHAPFRAFISHLLNKPVNNSDNE